MRLQQNSSNLLVIGIVGHCFSQVNQEKNTRPHNTKGKEVVFSLRWPNTVFDTCVSFTFISKTLDPLVAKNSSKHVNNASFGFWTVKLTYMPLPWQHE